MRIKQVGNKADSLLCVIHNADTAVINAGQPVVLVENGTNDGLDVVLPSTSGALNLIHGLRYGIATKNLNVGDYGEAVVFGICQTVTLEVNSRANSTASWSTYAAFSVGQYLSIDTVANYMVTAASTIGLLGLSSSTATAATTVINTLTISNPAGVLGQTLASYAGAASTTANTSLYQTAAVKAFIRLM